MNVNTQYVKSLIFVVIIDETFCVINNNDKNDCGLYLYVTDEEKK